MVAHIKLRMLTNFSVYATTVNTESVKFVLDGTHTQNENVAPFTLFGDGAGNYRVGTISVGDHSLTCTPYEFDGQSGTSGQPYTIDFSITTEDIALPPDTTDPCIPIPCIPDTVEVIILVPVIERDTIWATPIFKCDEIVWELKD